VNQAARSSHYFEQVDLGQIDQHGLQCVLAGSVMSGLAGESASPAVFFLSVSGRAAAIEREGRGRMAGADGLDSAELELLLPFHATGTLSNRDASCIERGLAAVPALAERYRQIQSERVEIVRLGDSLGNPSDRPLARLLATVTGSCASKRRMAKGEAAAAAPLASRGE
jgi:hypothetical protein